MKKLAIIILLAITSLSILAQNVIELKSGSLIKNAKLYEIKKSWIIYEKNGNLHDIHKEDVSLVLVDGIKVDLSTGEPIFPWEVQEANRTLKFLKRPGKITQIEKSKTGIFPNYDTEKFHHASFYELADKSIYAEVHLTDGTHERIVYSTEDYIAIKQVIRLFRARNIESDPNTNHLKNKAINNAVISFRTKNDGPYSIITKEDYKTKNVPARKDFRPYVPKAIISIDPGRAFGREANLRGSLEVPLNKTISIMTEYGYFINNDISLKFLNDNKGIESGHLFKVGGKFNLHLRKPPLRNTIYINASVYFSKVIYKDYVNTGLYGNGEYITSGLSITLGRQFICYNKLVLDFYWGLNHGFYNSTPMPITGLRIGFAR